MKVFLGSPFRGLGDVRRTLHDALVEEHEVIWMEDFGSQETDPLTACLRAIDDADVYVLLFGALYGTKLAGSEYSYTHLEYEHAEQTGTPVLAYVQHLEEGTERDSDSEDFLAQVRSTHLLEYKEFQNADDLIPLVMRDLDALRRRLSRPKFRGAAPVADEDAYVLGSLRAKILKGAPFVVSLIDAGAIADTKYRPQKRGRLGDKVESIDRIVSRTAVSIQIFNDLPVRRKGDIVAMKANRVRNNADLIIIFVPQEKAAAVIDLFVDANGELAVFHGDWFAVQDNRFVVRPYSDDDLNSCELRAAVLEEIEAAVAEHVVGEWRDED